MQRIFEHILLNESFCKVSENQALRKLKSFSNKYDDLGSIWYRGGYIILQMVDGWPHIKLQDIPGRPNKDYSIMHFCYTPEEEDEVWGMNWIEAINWVFDSFNKEELIAGTYKN